MSFGILILGLIALLPLLVEIKRQGIMNIDKPEKRQFLFEDEQGEKDNPFSADDFDIDDDEWKYKVE